MERSKRRNGAVNGKSAEQVYLPIFEKWRRWALNEGRNLKLDKYDIIPSDKGFQSLKAGGASADNTHDALTYTTGMSGAV